MIDAEAPGHAGPVVVDHHVGVRGQPPEYLPAGLGGQVEQDAPLVPVVDREADPAPAAVSDAELVAAGRPLDLDDLRPELAEQGGHVRPGDDRPEVQHAQAGQRRLGRARLGTGCGRVALRAAARAPAGPASDRGVR